MLENGVKSWKTVIMVENSCIHFHGGKGQKMVVNVLENGRKLWKIVKNHEKMMENGGKQ